MQRNEDTIMGILSKIFDSRAISKPLKAFNSKHKVHRNLSEETEICPYCNMKFRYKLNLRSHIKEYHIA